MSFYLQQKACIFDLDGTLLDSRKGFERALRYSLEFCGWKVGKVDLGKFIGPPIRQILEHAAPDLSVEVAEKVVAKFRENFDSTGCVEAELYPDVVPVLSNLLEGGARIYLATNKPRPATDKVLKHFKLERYFTGVFCPEVEKMPGPSKKNLVEMAFLETELKKNQVWVIGDTVEDLEAAEAAGCRFLAALYGYGNLRKQINQPTLCLESLRDVLKILKARD